MEVVFSDKIQLVCVPNTIFNCLLDREQFKTYTFDKDNRITKLIIPNNEGKNYISYTYDTLGRLKSQVITIGTSQFTTSYNFNTGGKKLLSNPFLFISLQRDLYQMRNQ